MDIKQGRKLTLLSPAPEKCPICADERHDNTFPHNRDSLFYQFWFQSQYGRSPTWADAAADCSPEMKRVLREHLIKNGIQDGLPEVEPEPQPEPESQDAVLGGESLSPDKRDAVLGGWQSDGNKA